jgi:hypothetical protein
VHKISAIAGQELKNFDKICDNKSALLTGVENMYLVGQNFVRNIKASRCSLDKMQVAENFLLLALLIVKFHLFQRRP